MPDNASQQWSRKGRLWKIILLNLIVIIVGIHLVAYQRESARWAGHPYPEAKKSLIKANFGLLYGRFLTSIPGINEKSLIMRPIKSLTDHYVEEAMRYIPDTDGEKEMYWYVFRWGYIVWTAKGTVLNRNEAYSNDEVRQILDEMWPVLEGIGTKEIKDPIFIEMRYAALGNIAQLYFVNQPLFHIDWEAREFDWPVLWKDEVIAERNQKLFHWLVNLEKLYAEKYPEIVKKADRDPNRPIERNKRFQLASGSILAHQIVTGKYRNNPDFCNFDKDIYLKYYLDTRGYLLNLMKSPETSAAKKEELKYFIDKKVDKLLTNACKNLSISQDDN
ncbi:MAG: hypothetical protein WC291_04080 [Thermodesulfovibrionales bacterium]|jgi:hypothetical protein